VAESVPFCSRASERKRGAESQESKTTLNRRLAIGLGITTFFGVAAVQGQEVNRAHVPFAFEAVGQRLEAGDYSARDIGGALLVRNNETGQGVLLLPVPVGLANSGQSSMTFRCYGSDCIPDKVQFGGTQRVYQVRPSSARGN